MLSRTLSLSAAPCCRCLSPATQPDPGFLRFFRSIPAPRTLSPAPSLPISPQSFTSQIHQIAEPKGFLNFLLFFLQGSGASPVALYVDCSLYCLNAEQDLPCHVLSPEHLVPSSREHRVSRRWVVPSICMCGWVTRKTDGWMDG